MNLNDFVVLPNNKARSVKLNARNLRELRMETVTLAQESKEMEERLQELRESMSREKEERGRSGVFRWRSGVSGAPKINSTAKRNKENTVQKQLAAGRVKIRVLKNEPLSAPPPPLPASGVHPASRQHRLRGKTCGQCEVKTAGLMCAECGEDYCVGCFAKFHQKGALRLHRMIPVQTELQTHVNTLDLVNRFQKQVNPGSNPSPVTNPSPCSKPNSYPVPDLNWNSNTDPSRDVASDSILSPTSNFKSKPIHKPIDDPESQTTACGGEWPPKQERKAGPTLERQHTEYCQVLVVNHDAEAGATGTEWESEEEKEGSAASPPGGGYDEEESARSFQEALEEWRGGRSEGGGGGARGYAVWRPAEAQPVSVSAMWTQADLPSDRGARGGGGGRGEREGRVPVKVEFTENSLSYLDRLLLKKHRRTPIETYRPLSDLGPALRSPAHAHTEEEAANSLTAEEEDFRRYCASLFAVSASGGSTEPQTTTPGSCLIIEVLDETVRDLTEAFVGEQKTDDSKNSPSFQPVSNEGSTLVDQTRVVSPRPISSTASPLSTQSRATAEPKGNEKLQQSRPQAPHSARPVKPLSSKMKPSPRPTSETPRTAKASINTSSSESQRSGHSTSQRKAKPDCGSPRLSSSPSTPRSHPETCFSTPAFPLSSSPHVFPLCLGSRGPSEPEEPPSPAPSISSSLRSTFTLSPSSSTESTLLPSVYKSPPSHIWESSLIPEQPDSPLICPESPSSTNQSQSVESPKRSQCSHFDLGLPLLPSRPQPPRESPKSPVIPTRHQSDSFTSPPLSSPRQPSQSPHSLEPQIKSALEPESSPSVTDMRSFRSSPKPPSSSSLSTSSPADVNTRYISTPPLEDPPIVSPSNALSGGCETTPSHQDTQCLQPNPPHLSNTSPQSSISMEKEQSLSMIDTSDEISSDSLGLTLHEEDSSDEEMKMDGSLEDWSSREEGEDAFIATPEESIVPVDPEPEADLETFEKGLLSQPSMAVSGFSRRAGSGSERFSGLDRLPTPGSDLGSDRASRADEHARFHPARARHGPRRDPDTLGAVMKENHGQPTGIHSLLATPTGRGEVSAYELGKSGSRSSQSWRSTPTPSRPASADSRPLSASLSRPASGASGVGSGQALRPLSRATQEIADICGADQTGCEDPDLDTDADAHALSCLERELRLMAKDTRTEALIVARGNSGTQSRQSNQDFTWGGVSEEQKEEEEEARRDRQSVRSLP